MALAFLKIALEPEIARICWLRQSYQRASYHSVIKSEGRDGWWKDCWSPSLLILPYESANLKVDNVKIVVMTWILGSPQYYSILGTKKCVECYSFVINHILFKLQICSFNSLSIRFPTKTRNSASQLWNNASYRDGVTSGSHSVLESYTSQFSILIVVESCLEFIW